MDGVVLLSPAKKLPQPSPQHRLIETKVAVSTTDSKNVQSQLFSPRSRRREGRYVSPSGWSVGNKPFIVGLSVQSHVQSTRWHRLIDTRLVVLVIVVDL